MRHPAVLVLLAVLTTPTGVRAGAEAGDLHVASAFGAIAAEDFDLELADDESFTASLGGGGRFRVGYLLTDALDVGLAVGVSYRDIELTFAGLGSVSDQVTGLGIGPYVDYRIPLDAAGDLVLAPGLALGYGLTRADAIDSDTFDVTPSLALQIFVTEKASIDVGGQLTYSIGTGGLEVNVTSALFDLVRRADVNVEGWSVSAFVGLSIWP